MFVSKYCRNDKYLGVWAAAPVTIPLDYNIEFVIVQNLFYFISMLMAWLIDIQIIEIIVKEVSFGICGAQMHEAQ